MQLCYLLIAVPINSDQQGADDFQPASVDTTKEGVVEVGEGHHVSLTVPHVEGSEKTHTVYKGNKRPVSKECVLIIDHDTGTFTLERLSNNINLKKTRMQGRPVTPVELSKPKPSTGKDKGSHGATSNLISPAVPVKTEIATPTATPSATPTATPTATPKLETAGQSPIGDVSDSSSVSDSDSGSSDSDSDDDDDKVRGDATVPTSIQKPAPAQKSHAAQPPQPAPKAQPPQPIHKPQPPQPTHKPQPPQPAPKAQQPPSQNNQPFMNFIKEDLCLSDTTDSDSD